MNIDLKTVVFMFLAAALGYGFSRLGKARDNKTAATLKAEEDAIAEVAKQKEIVTELQRKIAVLEAEALPLTAAFKAALVAKLTHFHTPVMDALLKKLGPPSTITPDELLELEALIEERKTTLDTKIDEEERVAAKILLDVQRLEDIEAKRHIETATETILVSQPATEPPTPTKAPEETANKGDDVRE